MNAAYMININNNNKTPERFLTNLFIIQALVHNEHSEYLITERKKSQLEHLELSYICMRKLLSHEEREQTGSVNDKI